MSGKQEKGSSSLLMVLMLLAVGSLMLSGLSRQLGAQRFEVAAEIQFIKNQTGARSALAWGEKQSWRLQKAWQCQTEPRNHWQACLRLTDKGEALLAASGVISGGTLPITLWRWGVLQKGRLVASEQGWLDFCPLLNEELCTLPR
ncbi:YgdB family protein [Cedecea neteri]|uniref:YgdB family protein n=1 Tax=Cedecea neteri TaxID=158822 RepID=UPI002AA7A070|nr:YgdB family protein [Cedecea neteri]WPU23840.1 YgdB family protein [Cedecea neteri]